MWGWGGRVIGVQVRETFAYFIEFHLSWLPNFSADLLPPTPSFGLVGPALSNGFPGSWPRRLVGFEFPTLIIRSAMFAATVNARYLGWFASAAL